MTKIQLEDEAAIVFAPDMVGWSENYCFDAFDQERNLGYYVHLGRWSLDPRLWREQVFIYLPDGSLLLHRGYGYRDAPRGAAGALLSLVCDEPGQRWHLTYAGPARRTTEAELAAAPLPASALLNINMDIEFESTGVLYDFFAERAHAGVAFNRHFEQPGRVRGVITYENKSLKLDGFGYRDHSRGPRNIASMLDHCWIHGHFPGEFSFGLFGIRKRKDGLIVPEFERAILWDKNGELHNASVDTLPFMTSSDRPPPYRFQLDSDIGKMQLDARILRTQSLTVTSSFEFIDGCVPTLGRFAAYEQPTSFWHHGRQGIGHTERSTVW